MRFLHTILLSLAVTGTDSATPEKDPNRPCDDTHTDIVNKLNDAYGPENCFFNYPVPSFIEKLDNEWKRIYCETKVNFNGRVDEVFGDYYYSANLKPIYADLWHPSLTYGYLNFTAPDGLAFGNPNPDRDPDDDTCLDTFQNGHLNAIKELVEENRVPNPIGPKPEPCGDAHSDILAKLNDIFEEENCDDDVVPEGEIDSDLKLRLCEGKYEGGDVEFSTEYYFNSNLEPVSMDFSYGGNVYNLDFTDPPSDFYRVPLDNRCLPTFANGIFYDLGDRIFPDPDRRPCTDEHSDIVTELKSAFGDENCIEELREVFGNELVVKTCSVNVSGWYSYKVQYYYYPGSNRPRIMDVYERSPEKSIGVYYVDLMLPDIPRPTDDATCIEKAEGGSIASVLGKTKERACVNNPDPFQRDGEEYSCSIVGDVGENKRKKKCKNPAVAENCPGLCSSEEDCPCANNPFKFKERTCDTLESLKESKRKKKCGKKRFALNCRGVCNEQCKVSI